jgi:hypothetical protein
MLLRMLLLPMLLLNAPGPPALPLVQVLLRLLLSPPPAGHSTSRVLGATPWVGAVSPSSGTTPAGAVAAAATAAAAAIATAARRCTPSWYSATRAARSLLGHSMSDSR